MASLTEYYDYSKIRTVKLQNTEKGICGAGRIYKLAYIYLSIQYLPLENKKLCFS